MMAALVILSYCAVAVLGGPPNDDCAFAQPVSGVGVFTFDNSEATTDGSAEINCFANDDGLGLITQDVWFCWTPTESGSIEIDTCAGTTVDTRIAVYEGCECPRGIGLLQGCDDDECSTQTIVPASATEGEPLLIRIGSHPGVGGGAGTWSVRLDGVAASCRQPEDNCQGRGLFEALLSDAATAVVADDFTPDVDGPISEVCWWGAYLDGTDDCIDPDGDAFEVRYYLDDGGAPGALFAGPFKQADRTLFLSKPTPTNERLAGGHRDYAFRGHHAPVAVTASVCYWLEIVNATTGACRWHWEVGEETSRGLLVQDGADGSPPNGFSSSDRTGGDMAFCLNVPLGSTESCRPPTPVNDSCRDAIPIGGGLTSFDTTNATTGRFSGGLVNFCGELRAPCCESATRPRSSRDVWFDYIPPCDGVLRVDVCDALFDTTIGVREDRCGFSSFDGWIACSDDDCGDPFEPLQSQLELEVIGGRVYRLQIGGHESAEIDARGSSNCFEAHTPVAGVGCDDPVCAAAVCDPLNGQTSCCSTEWTTGCVTNALERCTGRGGPGTIDLQLVAPPPANETLRSYVDFLACFSGACGTGFCDPPIYPEPCCLSKDFDADGDVDESDYAAFRAALVGP